MESIAVWQGATLGGIVAWILISSYLNVTRKLRSFLQPWVAHHVIAGTPLIFQIQVSFNFCNYKRKPRSSFLFNCLYIYVFLLFIGVNFFFFGFFFFFSEIPALVFWCFVLWIVLCCFCALLHCLSPFAILGMFCLSIMWIMGFRAIVFNSILVIQTDWLLGNIVEWPWQIG